jgi:uncharacterized membrane protein (DUF106 family)
MKIKPLPLILIIMGVLIIAYPIADRIYSRLIEQKLMREWEERMRNQQNDDTVSANIINKIFFFINNTLP